MIKQCNRADHCEKIFFMNDETIFVLILVTGIRKSREGDRKLEKVMTEPASGSGGGASSGESSVSTIPQILSTGRNSPETAAETVTGERGSPPPNPPIASQSSTSSGSNPADGPSSNSNIDSTMNRREATAQDHESFRTDQPQPRDVTGLRGIRTFLQQWARNNGLTLPTSSNSSGDVDIERFGSRAGTDRPHSSSNNSQERASGSISHVGISSRGRVTSSPLRRGSSDHGN
jgi:hypothetical protein